MQFPMRPMPSPLRPTGPGAGLAVDLMVCLRFYSRLPIPALSFEPLTWEGGVLGRALRLAPVAGLVLGGVAALALIVADRALGLTGILAATLALGAEVAASGALHEDGLADVADGFGGARTREHKLEIMRDSRIGAYGALALILSVLARASAIATLLDRLGLAAAAAALLGAGAASRGFGLLPLATLPSARTDGLAHASGGVPKAAFTTALALALAFGAALPVCGGLAPWRGLAGCGAALGASFVTARLARRQIGGQTGDVSGAAQQLAEIAYLLTLLIAPRLR